MESISTAEEDQNAKMAPVHVLSQESGKNWTLYHGDCIDVMRGLPNASIHYSIFSPPFASLYTYSSSLRDLGNCSTNAEFLDHFGFVAEQLRRVLIPGRLISFHCMPLPTSKTRDGFIGARDFPGDLIRAFEAQGFIYHSEVCIWKDPVTAMQRTKALGLLYKQLCKDSCMSRQGYPDKLITMRAPGDNPEPVVHPKDKHDDDRHISLPLWQRYASPVWMDINPSDTLQYRSAREHDDERHICPLQLEVIRRGIKLWSNPGDVVLSPFAGIGSEGFVSIQEGRRFVGAELKTSYFEQAVKNLHEAEKPKSQQEMFG
jgi:DNA modification methylase